jgi:hypothetical protein
LQKARARVEELEMKKLRIKQLAEERKRVRD